MNRSVVSLLHQTAQLLDFLLQLDQVLLLFLKERVELQPVNGRAADAGARYGIPTLGVVAVGKQMERTERFFLLATRVLAENGANIVKSYYCDGFERVAAACPVPIVIAGGKKLPELEALEMAYRAIAEGARGVDMGRNIFQSDCPAGMAQAIGKVVHEGYTAAQAYEVYEEVKHHSENA